MESQSNENNSNLVGYENKHKLLKLSLQNIKKRHSNTLIKKNINRYKLKRPISSYNYSINKKLYQSLNDESNKLKMHNKLGDNSNLKENIYFNAFEDNNSKLFKHSIEFNNKYKEQSKIIRDYFSDNKIEKNNNKVKLEKQYIRKSINNLRYNSNQNHLFSSFEKINKIKNKNITLNRNTKYSSLSTKNMTKQRTTFDNQDKMKCKSSKNINKPNFPLYKERKFKSSDNLISSNNLIEYKEVVCNSPEIPFNINYYKKKDYNNLIRIRNKQKNYKEKRYSFYKYKEYMDKIENEKIEIFKKEQEKRKMVNIQKIFHEIPNKNKKNQSTNKNEIKNIDINYEIKEDKNNNDKNLLNNNLNNNLKEDEHQNDTKILNNTLKEDEHQSDIKIDKKNEVKIILKKSSKKNKININTKFINALKKNNSLQQKAISHTHKKKKNKEKDEYESSYSEPDITVNNFFYSKINLPKMGKKDINSEKKIINFNKIKKYEKNIFNPEELLISNNIKNDFNISNDDFNIGMFNDKDLNDLKDKIGDSEAYELLKKKYFKNKERMMMINKRNIKAQKILLKNIIESDKDHQLKRPSQLEPFFNLKFKYTDEEINIYKHIFFNKYHEKNKNNFTPTRSKESLNNINNMNSNLNQDNTEQYNSQPPKNIEENNEINIKEKSNIEEPHNNKDDKIDADNIGTDKIDDDKLVGDITKNYTGNDNNNNNGTIINSRENIKKKKKKKKDILKILLKNILKI